MTELPAELPTEFEGADEPDELRVYRVHLATATHLDTTERIGWPRLVQSACEAGAWVELSSGPVLNPAFVVLIEPLSGPESA